MKNQKNQFNIQIFLISIKNEWRKKDAENRSELFVHLRHSLQIFLNFSALDDESLQGVVPSMGRITGSASIETLVRVGIEKENGLGPESKMVVLHDFTPCVDDELEVKRGQIVHVLYQV